MAGQITQHNSPQAFLQAAGKALYASKTVNNLMLGVSERLVAEPDATPNPFFATITDEAGGLLLAAVMTPPHNLILAGGAGFKRGLQPLIAYLDAHKIAIPGVIGPAEIAEAFVGVWAETMGGASRLAMRQRVYEMHQVCPPPMPPGEFRQAGPEDVTMVTRWLKAFAEEALAETGTVTTERVQQAIEKEQVFLWQGVEGPLSMAMWMRPITHSVTIGGVYTPPENRRVGYATALVARLSEYLLKRGYAFVTLFTDLDNPTSNDIYQKIGYEPVCDFRVYEFIKGEESAD